MAEGAKLRLVRCPKCDNLLPELRAYTVYQCGGCGTALQVQMRSSANDGSSVKSNDEERVNLGSELLDKEGEIDGVVVREMGDSEENSNTNTNTNTNCSSSSRTENIEERMENMPKWRRDRGGSVEQESGLGTYFRRPSKAPVDSYISEDDQQVVNRKEIGEMMPQIGTMALAKRPEQVPSYQGVERDGTMAYGRTAQRNVAQVPRYSKSTYADEGPSNYQPPSSHYGYGESMKNQNNLDVPARMEYLEQDRADLLRQLEELKDQLIRSDVSGKPKERAPTQARMVSPDSYGGSHENWMPESSSESNRAPLHAFMQDKQVQRPPYFSRSHGHASMMNRNDMDFHKPYPQTRPSHEFPRYGDNFGPQIHERVPNQLPRRYPQQQSHDYYYYDQYMEGDPDPVLSYPNDTFFHHPTCSCFHCYNKQWQMPKHAPSAVVRNRRIPDAPTKRMYYHVENSGTAGPRGYNPRVVNHPPLHSYEPRPLLRRPHDLDAAVGGCIRTHAEKEGPAKKSARRCNPMSGGAPFIACCNCFELLQLPRKFLLIKKNRWKLQCGACSTVMEILMENKRLVVSVSAETKESPSQVTGASVGVIKEGTLHSNGHAKRSSVNSYSDDFGNSGYSYESLEPEHVPVLSAIDKRVNLKDYEKMQGTPSSASSVTEGEESPDSVIVRRELSRSAELPVKESVTPPLPGSPLLEHFEYSSYQRQVTKLGKGNKSKRMDQEEVVLTKALSRHDSLKDASTATEMEVSFNEYSNTVTSQDSEEISKDEHRPRIGKGGGSFFLGLIKKSLRDTSGSTQVEENDEVANVSVNGHPVPEQLIKKAEKRAGKILPGQYWYDFRAGFWGVMGQRCLGVIPPFIEELNFPMPKDCAGGTTGVFVNGRELHERDLDLLASRGLPTARDKSYIIEISGRVLDEDTGEELDGLGKLAPTIEKLKHGFGMRIPGVAA